MKPKQTLHVIIQAENATTAEELLTIYSKAREYGLQQMGEEKVPFNDKTFKEMFPQLFAQINTWTNLTKEKDRLTLSLEVVPVLTDAGKYLAPLLGENAKRLRSMNNLKQLTLAIHNYESAFGTLPRDITDKDGKPLLSWRVAILPFIEQENLYRQFKLDEPWDSPNNKVLSETAVKVFLSPQHDRKTEPWKTTYLGFAAPNSAFPGGKQGLTFKDFSDGTSNTIMLVESNAASAEPWAKPADIKPDAKDPHKPVIGPYPDGFLASMADGSVRFFKKSISKEVLNALITRNGGEVIPIEDLK
jgi:hypothetical protein